MELIVTGLDIEEKARVFTDELFRSLGGKDQFDEVSIQLIRTDKEEPLTNEEAMAILKIDVKKLTSTVDFMVIASGTSSRHIRGLSEIAMAEAKKNNLSSIGVEGQDGSDWILIDFGDFFLVGKHESVHEDFLLKFKS